MKTILSILLCFGFVFCKGQKFKDRPCSIDTVYGIIYYQSTGNTISELTYGYYIAPCGGYQIGHFYGYEDAPTFIPAYFIRNDYMVNGKRKINEYHKQRNEGYFTNSHFKKIPFESVYGMVVKNKTK